MHVEDATASRERLWLALDCVGEIGTMARMVDMMRGLVKDVN